VGAVKKSVARFLAVGDVAGLLAHTRAQFGDATMSHPAPPATAPAPAPAPPAPAPADPAPKTFTQDEVNAMLARERTQTQQAAAQQLATDLGCSVDEAKQIIADRKAADDAKRTEAERPRTRGRPRSKAPSRSRPPPPGTSRREGRARVAARRLDVENATILTAAMARRRHAGAGRR
jgi:hypothetical protein